MKKLISLVLFSFSIASAQQIAYTVKDQEGKPLPYVSIQVNDRYGILTDNAGKFTLYNYEKPQHLLFEKVGFSSLNITHDKLNQVVVLEKLPEKALTPLIQGTKVLNLGYSKKQKLIKDIRFRANYNYEAGITLPYETRYKSMLLAKVRLMVYFPEKTSFPLRLNVYSLDSKGAPARNLLHKEIIFQAPNTKQWTEISLEEQGIPFPESGVALTVELLNPQMSRVRNSRPIFAGFEHPFVFRYELVEGWIAGKGETYAMELEVKGKL
ncbi:carboxypeptidase-like regulatory domain-containing protein [Leadbetterella byssophila]|nr:carboxypeptidase-like regulatory domain-containing protein [Leadbetterella byssophila]